MVFEALVNMCFSRYVLLFCRRFRVVKTICDKLPLCTEKKDQKIALTDFRSDTSTLMTDFCSVRKQNSSPRRSIYSDKENHHVEQCDLIASVLSTRDNT